MLGVERTLSGGSPERGPYRSRNSSRFRGVSSRQWTLLAIVLSPIGAGAFYLSYDQHGTLRTVGLWLGIAYVVFVILLKRWMDRRFANRNAKLI